MNLKELKKFFSEFWRIKEDEINEDLKLDDENLNNHSSVRFYQFIVALESNFDVIIKNIGKITTFGDLIKNIESKK